MKFEKLIDWTKEEIGFQRKNSYQMSQWKLFLNIFDFLKYFWWIKVFDSKGGMNFSRCYYYFTACFLINEGISNFDIQEKLKSYLADGSIKKI